MLVLLGGAMPAQGQDWRTSAEARIDQHRKVDLRIVVRDAAGEPVEGAAVRMEMTRHAFKFGTAVNSYWARAEPRADPASGDLDLGEKTSAFRVRLDVPQGAVIERAFLQFTADKDNEDEPTSLTIRAVADDDAPDFDAVGISSRELAAPAVPWIVSTWAVRGERGVAQRSPDVGALVQEVVNREGWRAGQHIAFVIEGSGKRSAQTFDESPTAAPRLVVTVGGVETSAQVAQSADDAEVIVPGFLSDDAERYRSEIVRLFNYAAPENALKWRPWEGDPVLARGTVDWLTARDIPVHGHAMIWSSLRWDAIPEEVEARLGEPAYVRERAAEHVRAIATAYAGEVPEWDVLNEPLHETDLEQAVGFDERVRWFQIAHEADPAARLFVNEFDVLEDDALLEQYKTLIRDLTAAGAPVGGIGIQGHFLGSPTPPEELVRRFDSLAELGLPIQITEFDMSGSWSQDVQARFMEDALVATFAEPRATAFTMWGFWDGNHWLGNAPLFTRDWTLKPSGQVWMDYVFNRWWTEAEGVSDAGGAFEQHGFKGTYEVTVDYQGAATTRTLTLEDDTTVAFDLGVSTDVQTSPLPEAFALRGVYPNPFSRTTTLRFDLPTSAVVRVEVFDVLGRVVRSRPPETLAPGQHRLPLDAGGLASGSYVVRVSARSGGVERVGAKPVLLIR